MLSPVRKNSLLNNFQLRQDLICDTKSSCVMMVRTIARIIRDEMLKVMSRIVHNVGFAIAQEFWIIGFEKRRIPYRTNYCECSGVLPNDLVFGLAVTRKLYRLATAGPVVSAPRTSPRRLGVCCPQCHSSFVITRRSAKPSAFGLPVHLSRAH